MSTSSAVRELAERLKLKVGDPALLEQALTHPSYLNENPDFPLDSNERLEFLGDAVIAVVVALELYRRCPGGSEGDLTRNRAHLVSGASLARIGRRLGVGDSLRMGRGEEATGGRERESNLAAAFEAIVGAAFLDGGYDAARKLLLRVFKSRIDRLVRYGIPQDAKARLQELAQGKGMGLPRYELVDASGPEHARVFTVCVKVGEETLGRGQGKRKADAERAAARKALERLS